MKSQQKQNNKSFIDLNRIRPIYHSFRVVDDADTLSWKSFTEQLSNKGIDIYTDPRFEEVVQSWRKEKVQQLSIEKFAEMINSELLSLEKISQGELIIPDFKSFTDEIRDIFHYVRKNVLGGQLPTYIPQLTRVDPEKFSVSICTVDNQRFDIGDYQDNFCVQSISKPISYCLALDEHGESFVHRHIGREPSGHAFNELTLNYLGLPHNPMVNSGAIMTASMIKKGACRAERFEYIMSEWTKLMGNCEPTFSNPVYLSERETGFRNFALGYFMQENKSFPDDTNLIETLEFYFQCCSIEATSQMLAVAAATLANGGVCPATYQHVFDQTTVQHCLSLMYSCGMYDFSGEWSFLIGLPAKSGVSGGILVVIPNVMGICIWSPRLDSLGNSVRGIEFAKELLKKYSFHNFDSLIDNKESNKIDPCKNRHRRVSRSNADLIWACSTNNLQVVQNLIAKKVNLLETDYDGRSALHLAASEGHLDIVKILIQENVPVSLVDRWGNTPLDDAIRENHIDVVTYLQSLDSKTSL